MEKDKLIELLCDFFTSVGIEWCEKDVKGNSFLPGVEIENGVLIFKRTQLTYPGDLLHEAGHIALTKAVERKQLNGDVIATNAEKKGDEIAVMLWTYAACVKLNLPPEIVFHSGGYKGESDWILTCYKNKNYLGLPLLVWMGLTADVNNSISGFPLMHQWLRD